MGQLTHSTAKVFPGFCSSKLIKSISTFPGWIAKSIACHLPAFQVCLTVHQFPFVFLDVEGTVKVKCLAQGQNTATPRP